MKKLVLLTAIMCLVYSGGAALADDGGVLYRRNCAGCHGPNADMLPALRGQDKDVLNDKLNGYRAGTFGGKNKATMEKVMKKISIEDQRNIITFINGL